MNPTHDRDRDGPGTQFGGERHTFPQTAANSPSHPERTPQEASSTIPQPDSGHKRLLGPETGREPAGPGLLIHDSGWQPDAYFDEARLVVVGAPDCGLRSKTIDDVVYGRWDRRTKDNPGLGLSSPGVRVPRTPPRTPPVLEGGAAVRIEEDEVPALVA